MGLNTAECEQDTTAECSEELRAKSKPDKKPLNPRVFNPEHVVWEVTLRYIEVSPISVVKIYTSKGRALYADAQAHCVCSGHTNGWKQCWLGCVCLAAWLEWVCIRQIRPEPFRPAEPAVALPGEAFCDAVSA